MSTAAEHEGPEEPSGAAVVDEMARRFGAGDLPGVQALLHPALRIDQPASLPHGGVHHGLDGMRQLGAPFAEHWERTIADPRIYDTGVVVVQITTQSWRAKTTGKSATVDVVELFTIIDGQISEIRVFQQDTAALLATLA